MGIELLVEALQVMGIGYLGTFLVTGAIICMVNLLRKLTANR